MVVEHASRTTTGDPRTRDRLEICERWRESHRKPYTVNYSSQLLRVGCRAIVIMKMTAWPRVKEWQSLVYTLPRHASACAAQPWHQRASEKIGATSITINRLSNRFRGFESSTRESNDLPSNLWERTKKRKKKQFPRLYDESTVNNCGATLSAIKFL